MRNPSRLEEILEHTLANDDVEAPAVQAPIPIRTLSPVASHDLLGDFIEGFGVAVVVKNPRNWGSGFIFFQNTSRHEATPADETKTQDL